MLDLPHEGVVARLGPSPIAGVGVFAIRTISKGAVCFAHDLAELRWIDATELNCMELSDEERALYRDFAVRRDGRLGCPSSFDLLTPGWYLNQPRMGEVANISASETLQYSAVRDIRPGEELTIDYEKL